ncbi:brg1-associated factor b [Dichomitus squalens]|uniref:Brg1-associated factor b n=1 Tax=Dichomitus squalens TaxID=114155 RepID=A0A4Q9P331_9APHY|nr:brg1-associated factor b [Dichomitus squalens]TBU48468.1 brg1-associated factor b [Dichomitus squalens]TBU58770.1 brg1-associated factor b [Dichomitus squalens]
MVNYGGDEVSALVLDFGTSSLRAGYAGDDTPKAIIPTSFGFIEEPAEANGGDVTMGEAGATEGEQPQASKPKVKLYIGQNGPSLWRSGMQIGNPMQDSLIQNFDAIPPLISHALSEVMRCNASEHPVLVTEAAWNSPANRERMAEIMFEEFQVPAFYIANTGVLNAFAAGKGSALVIDVGHSTASVIPVVDGFVLRKGLMHCALPQLVHAHAKHLLTSPTPTRQGIQLIPHQLIASRTPVDAGVPPRFTLREDRRAGTTDSWRAWAENREVEEWIQSIGGVLPQGWNDSAATSQGSRHYEFPTGYNNYFTGVERYAVGEQYFAHSAQLMASNPNLPKTIPSLVTSSIGQCDLDLRQVLLGNVVLTGGGSLFAGFADRLANDMGRAFQHVKIHAPGNPTERRYGGWLGGSILASLGTFHQLWISKEEWQEHGRAIVGQRCK